MNGEKEVAALPSPGAPMEQDKSTASHVLGGGYQVLVSKESLEVNRAAPRHTQGCTSGPLWQWPRDSSWPMSGEHSDQVTHRLGKLTARARPLPKLFFFLPGPW